MVFLSPICLKKGKKKNAISKNMRRNGYTNLCTTGCVNLYHRNVVALFLAWNFANTFRVQFWGTILSLKFCENISFFPSEMSVSNFRQNANVDALSRRCRRQCLNNNVKRFNSTKWFLCCPTWIDVKRNRQSHYKSLTFSIIISPSLRQQKLEERNIFSTRDKGEDSRKKTLKRE